MNLGPGHLLLIGIALLIFFGPSRLPELGKSLVHRHFQGVADQAR